MTGQALELFDGDPQNGPDSGRIPADHQESDLFTVPSGPFGAGPTEAMAVATLVELHQARQFTAAQRLTAQVIRSLAQNIDKGNLKGRAVGNEAMQLQAALESLTATADDQVDDSDIPAETRELMNALANPPAAPVGPPAWADPAPGSDTA